MHKKSHVVRKNNGTRLAAELIPSYPNSTCKRANCNDNCELRAGLRSCVPT